MVFLSEVDRIVGLEDGHGHGLTTGREGLRSRDRGRRGRHSGREAKKGGRVYCQMVKREEKGAVACGIFRKMRKPEQEKSK